MRLHPSVLAHRIEAMPTGSAHTTVWHLCDVETHSNCATNREEMLVTFDATDLPDNPTPGSFLMRLHPLTRDLHKEGLFATVDRALATSFPHATVWSVAVEDKR